MVIFDATTLIAVVAPHAAIVPDGKGGNLTLVKERVDGLLAELRKQKVKIILPTPAIAEAFVRTDAKAALEYIATLKKSRHFLIENFCEAAAFEVSQMTAKAKSAGDKKDGSDEVCAKIKYDRQIVAIGLVNRASRIYTDDGGLAATAQKSGITPIAVASLPVPTEKAQIDWVRDAETEA